MVEGVGDGVGWETVRKMVWVFVRVHARGS
jgi:hypothetical protein